MQKYHNLLILFFMKKHLLLLFPAFVFFLCTGLTCDESSDEKDPESIDLQSINVYHLNNAGEKPVLAEDNAEVPKEAYALRISLTPQQKLSENGYYQLSDKTSGIEIITNKDLNEKFRAGSNVTECFRIIPSPYGYGNTELSKYNIYVFNGYPGDIDIALLTSPAAGEQQFTVSLIFESGRKLSATTPIVTLH